LYLLGGVDRTGDLILTNKVFHAMHIILGLKLGDHEGLGLLLKRTLPVVLLAILIHILIHAFLNLVPVSS